jgi:hypothetical protein
VLRGNLAQHVGENIIDIGAAHRVIDIRLIHEQTEESFFLEMNLASRNPLVIILGDPDMSRMLATYLLERITNIWTGFGPGRFVMYSIAPSLRRSSPSGTITLSHASPANFRSLINAASSVPLVRTLRGAICFAYFRRDGILIGGSINMRSTMEEISETSIETEPTLLTATAMFPRVN